MPELAAIVPQFFPESWRQEFNLVGVNFAPGVCVGFALRGDGGYSFISEAERAVTALTTAELLSRAFANLAELKDGVELHVAHPQDAVVVWIESKDNFAAVRMLLPSVKSKLISMLGNTFLFTIPSRDLCLFWTMDAPAPLTTKHAREAMEAFESEQYNLTGRVLVFSNQLYDGA